MRSRPFLLTLLLVAGLAGCGGGDEAGEPVRVRIPPGSGLGAVTDTLAAHEVIRWPYAFRMYVRMRGADRAIRPGTYELPQRASWAQVVERLTSGAVVTQRFTIPEGWTARQIGTRLAAVLEIPEDSVLQTLFDPEVAARFEVPGPTLEGYLYPSTYEIPLGATLDDAIRAMVQTYRRAWRPEWRERADSLGMTEQEVVTLASIVEAEARVWTERDTIAAVYHNRLRRGMRLQADPTVQYALAERQSRLLFAHIDETADNPYNTYRHDGLPPGPIGSPSRGAIEATLFPADVDFLFFIARPDGTHIFTRTFNEHIAARQQLRREAAAAARNTPPQQPAPSQEQPPAGGTGQR